jgi:hypothetical protein
MDKLSRNLSIAFEEAVKMQPFALNEYYDCGVINSYGKKDVRLVLVTFEGAVQVWLTIFTRDENNQVATTKYGVQFSTQDNLDALAAFLHEKNKE